MKIVHHPDLALLHCYVQELPRLVNTLEHETFVSEPADYISRVFYVPYFIRNGNIHNHKAVEDAVNLAMQHYITKMGHPGRDNVLKITVVEHKIGLDDAVQTFTLLDD